MKKLKEELVVLFVGSVFITLALLVDFSTLKLGFLKSWAFYFIGIILIFIGIPLIHCFKPRQR